MSFGIEDSLVSPTESLNGFISCAVTNVEEKHKEQYQTVLNKIINNVIQKKHGTIAIVYTGDNIKSESIFMDGQILEEPINIIDKISRLKNETENGQHQLKFNSDVISYLHLISGMMISDGITIFDSAGSLLAYNVFIKDDRKDIAEASPQKKRKGGARSRAFEFLASLPNSKVGGVFMQSQDGALKFKKNG